MKRKGKLNFFIVAFLIISLAYTAFFGVSSQYGDITTIKIKGANDIRYGIDIRGGVDVTFTPAGGFDANAEQLSSAEETIKMRLVNLGITDYEIYKDDANNHIIVRFPWKEGETDFNPEHAIDELGASAMLTFREGYVLDENGLPSGITAENVIIEGKDVENATAVVSQNNGTTEYLVQLELYQSGMESFSEATKRLAGNGTISIWMDELVISNVSVQSHIPDGVATIRGNFTAEEAVALANKINAGALPFALEAESFSTISPTLGMGALQTMLLAGVIALALVCVYMVFMYRLPGAVASLALLGQLAGTIAAISGFLPAINSFTLTLPGIAGIILSIGMAVDANVITFERIKEELQKGKTLDNAIQQGFAHGLAPVLDGNITVLIVAVVLLGAFGPANSPAAKLLSIFFKAFGPSTVGMIYSFGFTLLVGVILNLAFGVFASRVMLRSLSKQSFLRNPALYGSIAAKPVRDFDFIANRKKMFTASAVLLCAVLVFSAVFGVKTDIQFSGGALMTYSYTGEVDIETVEDIAGEILGGDVTVQSGSSFAGGSTIAISCPGGQATAGEVEELLNALQGQFEKNQIEQLQISNVSAGMGQSFFAKSILSLAIAALFILIYIALRFKNIGGLPGGVMAVIALMHDLILVFGLYSVLRIPLDGNFIAAMLTILGYSINDTVVVYDRIRENKKLYGNKHNFSELVNLSINQSKVRSLRTTITTVLALGAVCIVTYMNGVTSIAVFALTLIIGMVSGVYSSICIAGPLWALWVEKNTVSHSRKPAKKTKKA